MTLEEQDDIRMKVIEHMLCLIEGSYLLDDREATETYVETYNFAIDKIRDHWGINLTGDAA